MIFVIVIDFPDPFSLRDASFFAGVKLTRLPSRVVPFSYPSRWPFRRERVFFVLKVKGCAEHQWLCDVLSYENIGCYILYRMLHWMTSYLTL